MPQPYNYNVELANPMQYYMEGLKTSNALYDAEMQRQRAAEQASDLKALYNSPNPTVSDYVRISTKYPELAAKFKDVMSSLDKEQQTNRVTKYTQILSALQRGDGAVANDLLQSHADALRNSGDEQGARATEKMGQLAAENPRVVIDSAATALAGYLGPEKFAQNYEALFKTPSETAKLQAETQHLPTKYALDDQKSVEDIETSRLKRKLDVLDTQAKLSDSETKRKELGLKKLELQGKLDKITVDKQEKTAAKQSALSDIDTQMETIDKIISSPLLKDTFLNRRSTVGSVYGLASQHVPGSDMADFSQLVETAQSQQLLSSVLNLKTQGGTLGQVTEKEGEALKKSKGSLSTKQSLEAFVANAKAIKKSLETMRRAIIASGDLPVEGDKGSGSFVVKSPKYGNVTEGMINRALQDNPGLTREQALQFFSGQ